jgi:RNA polymerase-binding transcription factor DksA
MEKTHLESIKRALLREVDRALWNRYRQNLDEVLNDIALHRFDVPRKPGIDDVIRILRSSGLFATQRDPREHELQDALRRIESGSFGLCLRCGREISVAVLERDPTTRYCTACKQHENNRSLSQG